MNVSQIDIKILYYAKYKSIATSTVVKVIYIHIMFKACEKHNMEFTCILSSLKTCKILLVIYSQRNPN